MSASMIATCNPWNKSTNPPGMVFAATANTAPTRIGQHQLPMMAGIAARREHVATKSDCSSPSFTVPNCGA